MAILTNSDDKDLPLITQFYQLEGMSPGAPGIPMGRRVRASHTDAEWVFDGKPMISTELSRYVMMFSRDDPDFREVCTLYKSWRGFINGTSGLREEILNLRRKMNAVINWHEIYNKPRINRITNDAEWNTYLNIDVISAVPNYLEFEGTPEKMKSLAPGLESDAIVEAPDLEIDLYHCHMLIRSLMDSIADQSVVSVETMQKFNELIRKHSVYGELGFSETGQLTRVPSESLAFRWSPCLKLMAMAIEDFLRSLDLDLSFRRCKKCSSVFVTKRDKHGYCSRTCRQQVSSGKYYVRNFKELY